MAGHRNIGGKLGMGDRCDQVAIAFSEAELDRIVHMIRIAKGGRGFLARVRKANFWPSLAALFLATAVSNVITHYATTRTDHYLLLIGILSCVPMVLCLAAAILHGSHKSSSLHDVLREIQSVRDQQGQNIKNIESPAESREMLSENIIPYEDGPQAPTG